MFPPNLLYGYLMIIATGLQGLQIEKNAEKILKQLSQMDTDFSKVEEDFQTLGRHLTNARGKYDETQQKFDRFGLRLRSLESDSE